MNEKKKEGKTDGNEGKFLPGRRRGYTAHGVRILK